MSVSGLCQMCENAPARRQCGRCGLLVCDRHFDAGERRCTRCAVESGGRDRGPGGP